MGGTTEPTTQPPIVVAGHPSFLDSIDWGTKLASNTVKVYFAGNGEVFDGKTSVGWNAYEQQQAMLGFEQFSNVADLHFIVTDDASEADLKLVNKAQANFLGYFNPPGTNGAGVGVFNQGGTAWDEDQPGQDEVGRDFAAGRSSAAICVHLETGTTRGAIRSAREENVTLLRSTQL